MLKETKLALRVNSTAYDADIASLIMAGVSDLRVTAGVDIRGVKFTFSESGVTDESTLKDELIKRAVITYVRMHFGSPSDYDKLKASYDEQKAQLITATGYGLEVI